MLSYASLGRMDRDSVGEAEREAMAVYERACQDAPLKKSYPQIPTK
jgi:hypothetical protein